MMCVYFTAAAGIVSDAAGIVIDAAGIVGDTAGIVSDAASIVMMQLVLLTILKWLCCWYWVEVIFIILNFKVQWNMQLKSQLMTIIASVYLKRCHQSQK